MIEAPYLIGKKVYLRSIVRDDVKGNWFRWFNDSEINQYMYNGTFPNNEKTFDSFIDNIVSTNNNCVLAICDNKSRSHIGNIGIHRIDWINRVGEYGIVLGEKEFMGKGYASEASRLLLTHAFNRLNLRKIWLGVFANNEKAILMYERIGFIKEAVLQKEIKRNNHYVNIIRMCIFNEDWFNKT